MINTAIYLWYNGYVLENQQFQVYFDIFESFILFLSIVPLIQTTYERTY